MGVANGGTPENLAEFVLAAPDLKKVLTDTQSEISPTLNTVSSKTDAPIAEVETIE